MGTARDRMMQDLEAGGYDEGTREAYLAAARDFAWPRARHSSTDAACRQLTSLKYP